MGQTLTAMTSQASLALMKFLSDLSRQLGVGKHTYVVGGAVRNFVIDQPIKDIDVVIDSVALKGKDSAWFADQVAKAIPVQTKITTNQYGVALLHIVGDWMLGGTNLKGEDIEIANARRESYTDGGYTPTDVQPADIYEDTVRREFTFNTLLWRLHDLAEGPDKAEILDLTGCGLRDLQEGVMRCPVSPDKTFSDDPSRMIRAIKFLIKYGFTISLEVKRSIEKNKAKLKNIPHAHLSNMLINTFLREPTGKKALLEMQKLGLLDVIKEIAQTQKPFREALANWADKEAKVEFLFDLMDLGLPAGKRLSFLTAQQQEQVRDITVKMHHAEADTFLQVLSQPGKVLNTQALMLEYNLKGSDVRQITDVARGVLLTSPELVKNPTNLMARVRMGLAPGVRIVAKTFELNPGDPILYGKFLNKPGTISGFGVNDKGDPTIQVESIHGGPPKELKLFKVRYDENRTEPPRIARRKLANPDLLRNYPLKLQALRDKVAYNKARFLENTTDLWLAWFNFYYVGREWAAYVIDHLALPPKAAKPVEMAVRLFSKEYPRGKGPPNIIQWFETNEARFDLLDQARTWPERSEESGVLKIGPFEVHDTIQASPKAMATAKDIITRAVREMQSSGVSGFAQMVYGQLFLVGQLARKNWAAWYMPDKDTIYLRPGVAGSSVEESARHLIHEVGHRFWKKGVSQATKTAWTAHHTSKTWDKPPRRLPEVGEVLAALVNGKKVKVDQYDAQGAALLVEVTSGTPVGKVQRFQLSEWVQEADHKMSFPTLYSEKGGPEEHFCESLSLYCQGRLTGDNLAAFEKIVLGVEPTRVARLVARFKQSDNSPFVGLSPTLQDDLQSFAVSLAYWMGNATPPSLANVGKVYRASKELRAWLAQNINLASYNLYFGGRLSAREPLPVVGAVYPRPWKVLQWSTEERVSRWFSGLNAAGGDWAGGVLVQAKASRNQVIVDVDRFSTVCGRHHADFAALMKGHSVPIEMFKGETFEGEILTTTQVQGVVVESRWLTRSAAAKYKNKKTVKTKDGDEAVVYEYSEKQVQNRNREKAERVEKLRGNLHKLQSQVKKDLKSDDPKTRLCALAVGLMNDTYERVGNDESAKDGHVGVTGWTPEHVKFSDGKATFTYVGKSGVKHTKETKDTDLIRVLKEAVKDKKKGETLFTYKNGRVDASAVNEYLDGLDLGITAKDIRGLHANREMQERLKAVRSKGGKLPEDKKEREKKLKDEFKEALEGAAEAVGHEPATLKSQYLVPGLEDTYLKDGTVLDKLHEKKSSFEEMVIRRLATRYLARRVWERPQPGYWVQVLDMGGKEKARHWVEDFKEAQESAAGASQAPGVQRVVLRDRTNLPMKAFVRGKPVGGQMEQSVRKLAALYLATKSDAQKEDKDIRQMLKPDPEKKPPREDLRRYRMRTDDPDMAGESDKDLSLNYKKVARLVGRWLRAGESEPEHKPGEVWKSEDGRWTAKNPEGNSHTFDEKPAAEAYAKGKDPDEKPKKDPTKALGALADALTSANGKAIESAKKELLAEHPELEAQVKEHLDAYEAANKDLAKAAIKAEGLSGKDKKDALKSLDALEAKRNEAAEAVRNLKPQGDDPEPDEPDEPEPDEPEPDEPEPDDKPKAPETPKPAPKPKKAPADPLGGKPLSESPLKEEDLVTRAEEAFKQFRAADKTKARKEAATLAVAKLAELDPESPQAKELNRIIDGIHLAMEMNEEKWDILGSDGKLLREPLNEKMGVLANQMVGQGHVRVLLSDAKDHHAVRESVRDAMGRLDDAGLQLMAKDTPWEPIGELLGGLGGMTLDPEVAELLRGLIRDLSINNMTTNQGLINAVAGKKEPASNPLEAFDDVKDKFKPKNLEDALAALAKCIKDGGKAADCKDLVGQIVPMQVKDMGENLDKAIKAAGVEPDPQNPHVAAIRHALETGDLSILDEKLEPARTFQEEKADFIKNLKDPEERKRVQEMDEAAFRAMLEGRFGD